MCLAPLYSSNCRGIRETLTCAAPVCRVCFHGQAERGRVLGESAEGELGCDWAASAVSDTGEGVRVGQAAALHRACAKQTRLRRRQLVVTLVLLLLVLLVQIHLAAPEGVQGEAGSAPAGCGRVRGGGVVLAETYSGDGWTLLSAESQNLTPI